MYAGDEVYGDDITSGILDKPKHMRLCQDCWAILLPGSYFPDDYGHGYNYNKCDNCGTDPTIVARGWV